MTLTFTEKLNETMTRNNSLLCVGLDPDLGRMSADFAPDLSDVARIKAFCLSIIEQTADLVCCYKPNAAFFEQFGPEGMAALRDVIMACHAADVPVLLDAKRGDIGNTAKAYARAAFEVWGADAITISPYLGQDSVAPFLAYKGKAVFLLCHTSNPSAADVQHHGHPALFEHIAAAGQAWGDASQLGFVVGATQIEALAKVREIAPNRLILAPGVGAQGGNLAQALQAGLDADGNGVIVPVSRGVLYADNPRSAAEQLRDNINQHRQKDPKGWANSVCPQPLGSLVVNLYQAGCVKFGDFTLASGKQSPIYVDLRRVISFPALFQQVVDAYAVVVETLAKVREIAPDHLAAVPYAALPATGALAQKLGLPMIYPRKEVKGYGTKQAVEGAFEPGQVAVAIEDVVTSGGSLLKAISTLQKAGLKVQDVIVLVDREQGGRAKLETNGVRLHAILTISQVLEALRAKDCITEAVYADVRAYLKA